MADSEEEMWAARLRLDNPEYRHSDDGLKTLDAKWAMEAEKIARAERNFAEWRLRREEAEYKRERRARKAQPSQVRHKCLLFPNRVARTLWVYEMHAEGETFRNLAKMIGISPNRVGVAFHMAESLIDRRRIHARAHRSRPIDMGGPRDVWLTFFPSSDPRLDNMMPCDGA